MTRNGFAVCRLGQRRPKPETSTLLQCSHRAESIWRYWASIGDQGSTMVLPNSGRGQIFIGNSITLTYKTFVNVNVCNLSVHLLQCYTCTFLPIHNPVDAFRILPGVKAHCMAVWLLGPIGLRTDFHEHTYTWAMNQTNGIH